MALCEAAVPFLDGWGEQAHALGWTTVDLFGVHPRAPFARNDCMGLVWFLPGKHLATLTSSTATLKRDRGHVTTFYRRQTLHPEATPLWNLCDLGS